MFVPLFIDPHIVLRAVMHTQIIRKFFVTRFGNSLKQLRLFCRIVGVDGKFCPILSHFVASYFNKFWANVSPS